MQTLHVFYHSPNRVYTCGKVGALPRVSLSHIAASHASTDIAVDKSTPATNFLFPLSILLISHIFSLSLFSISFANDLFFSLRPTGLSLCKKPFAVKPRDSEIGIRLTQMRSVMKNFFTARIYLNLRKHPNARRMCTVAIGTKLEAHFYIQFAPKSDTLTMTLFNISKLSD